MARLPEGEKIFRPVGYRKGKATFENSAKVRKTLAASRLSEMTKWKTVPKSDFAELNGRLGSVSELAPGKPPERPVTELVASGVVNPTSFRRNQLFEFLVGNVDAPPFW